MEFIDNENLKTKVYEYKNAKSRIKAKETKKHM